MGLYTLFVILIVIAALLMIGIVMIQESKGGGLASNFSSSNSVLGVRKTTDFIEKATWGLAIAMVVFSVVCAYVAPSANTDQSVISREQLFQPQQPAQLRCQPAEAGCSRPEGWRTGCSSGRSCPGCSRPGREGRTVRNLIISYHIPLSFKAGGLLVLPLPTLPAPLFYTSYPLFSRGLSIVF